MALYTILALISSHFNHVVNRQPYFTLINKKLVAVVLPINIQNIYWLHFKAYILNNNRHIFPCVVLCVFVCFKAGAYFEKRALMGIIFN